jgi:hypothetical protein
VDHLEYKYDVAFSFLSQDEALATELNDMLQDRLRTFLYSKKQGELAGTDGEKTFNAVFGHEARMVVVLYRSKWGQTPWTRIEETAIRNRAFEEGHDFLKFIPLDEPPTVPKWLPRTQLWVGLKRWGISGAASVIEARVEELGGEPHEETVTERAARLERSLTFRERRKQFLRSSEAVTAADKEFDTLRTELEQLVASVRASASSISIELKYAPRQIVMLGLLQGLSINWRRYYGKRYYGNSLENAYLNVELWDSHPPFQGIIHYEKPNRLDTMDFTFDLLPSDQQCWVSSDSTARAFATKDLASFLLKYFMDKVNLGRKR